MKKLLMIMSVLVMACSTTKPAVQPVAKEEAPQTEEPEQAAPPQEADEEYTMVEYKGKTWSIQLPSNKNFSDVKQTANGIEVKGSDGVFQFLVEASKEDTDTLAENLMAALFMQMQWQPSKVASGKIGVFSDKEILYQSQTGVLVALVFGTGTNQYVLVYGGKSNQSRTAMFRTAVSSLKVSDKPVVVKKPAKK